MNICKILLALGRFKWCCFSRFIIGPFALLSSWQSALIWKYGCRKPLVDETWVLVGFCVFTGIYFTTLILMYALYFNWSCVQSSRGLNTLCILARYWRWKYVLILSSVLSSFPVRPLRLQCHSWNYPCSWHLLLQVYSSEARIPYSCSICIDYYSSHFNYWLMRDCSPVACICFWKECSNTDSTYFSELADAFWKSRWNSSK